MKTSTNKHFKYIFILLVVNYFVLIISYEIIATYIDANLSQQEISYVSTCQSF